MISKHVYIIGSKGIPAKYGGFETFVEKLTQNRINDSIVYHVACMSENSAKSDIFSDTFTYNKAYCYNIKVPNIGPAKAIYYDIISLNYAVNHARKNNYKNPIFYILACRIGPWANYFRKKIHNINGTLIINPDGHEWKREKWSLPVKKYWKHSEKLMIKNSDLIICDNQCIEEYVLEQYSLYNPKTKYIAYGTDLTKSALNKNSNEVKTWYDKHQISLGDFYLIVGRFVPENNYESMIKEFVASNTNKKLVIITNYSKSRFYSNLLKATSFDKDERVKFVGTVYNQELLKFIRENAFAYIHGHEVGGTNPSLLEALSSTKLNLLIDVGFNRMVAKDYALYWKKNKELRSLINNLESKETNLNKNNNDLSDYLEGNFSWDFIVKEYESEFGKM